MPENGGTPVLYLIKNLLCYIQTVRIKACANSLVMVMITNALRRNGNADIIL